MDRIRRLPQSVPRRRNHFLRLPRLLPLLRARSSFHSRTTHSRISAWLPFRRTSVRDYRRSTDRPHRRAHSDPSRRSTRSRLIDIDEPNHRVLAIRTALHRRSHRLRFRRTDRQSSLSRSLVRTPPRPGDGLRLSRSRFRRCSRPAPGELPHAKLRLASCTPTHRRSHRARPRPSRTLDHSFEPSRPRHRPKTIRRIAHREKIRPSARDLQHSTQQPPQPQPESRKPFERCPSG